MNKQTFIYRVTSDNIIKNNFRSHCHTMSVPPIQQRGFILPISLIMLLLMAMISISGSQTTTLEERMASNLYDRNIAFQAAESALREAVTTLCPLPLAPDHCVAVPVAILNLTNKTITCSTTCICLLGLCPYSTTVTPEFYSSTFNWLSDKTFTYGGALSNIPTAQKPRYVIEMIAPALSGSTIVTFRITVIAWGVNPNTVVKLQTVHKIDYSGSDSVVL